MPMHACRSPTGVDTGTDSKRRCATQLPGDNCTASRVRRQCAGRINSRTVTVSPVLHIALFNSQPSSRDHGTSRGSRVSGSKEFHVGKALESFYHSRGKRLLSDLTASGGLAMRVLPPRKKYSQPDFLGNLESHSA